MSQFHRKQYIAIGEILRDTCASKDIIEAFCDLFEEDNHRFNVDKFMMFVESHNEGY
jgi:hypothetical protein